MSQRNTTKSKSRKRRERRRKLKPNKQDTSVDDTICGTIDYSLVIKQIEQYWPRFVSNPIVAKVVSDMNLTLFDPSNEELKIQILDKLIHYFQDNLLPRKHSIKPTFKKGEHCFMNDSFLEGTYATIVEVHKQYNLYDVKEANARFSFMDTWIGATSSDIISINSLQESTKQIFHKYAVGANEKVFDMQTFNLLFHLCGIKQFDAESWKELIEHMIKLRQKELNDAIHADTHSSVVSNENKVMNEELFVYTIKQFGININNCMLRYEYCHAMINTLLNHFLFDKNLCKLIVEYSGVKRENEYYSMWWNRVRMGGRADCTPNMTELLETLSFQMKKEFKFKVNNSKKQLIERYEKKWHIVLPENLKFIFSLNQIEDIICGAHPNNPVPLSPSEWKLLDDRKGREKLKTFDYDYAIKIMDPHQGSHCWYAVWNKNDGINAKVCIAWHPQQQSDDETAEPKSESIHFSLTSPNLITFVWDLASVGKCWFHKYRGIL